MTLTRDEAIKALFSDRRVTVGTLLEIDDKNRNRVPLIPNPIQADILANSSPTNRDIYVKPAQVGGTSIIVGDYYLDNITINGTVSVIISYDEFSAQRQILKARRYHRALERKIPTVHKLDHKSTTELSWESPATKSTPAFSSTMYIFSARSYVLGRGETIHNLLLDEYAFWPDGTHDLIMASAVQRVPLAVNTKIKILSTANGEDNPFHEVYAAAKEGSQHGGTIYTPHFYPWFIHPEYVMYADDIFCLPGDDNLILPDPQPEEELLLRKFSGTFGYTEEEIMNRLRWRRYKKAEVASLRRSGNTIFVFEQEYPEDDETCFITAGDMAYSDDIVAAKIRQCYPPPESLQRAITAPKINLTATLDVWREVEEGLGYLVSIDPGKGKTSESVGHVWHFMDGYQDKEGNDIAPTMQHCATLAGFYDEWEMAGYMKEVGYIYNGAVLCPEDNLDIVSHLRDYPDLYWREDTRTGKLIRAIGWQSNVSTKPYMITEVSRNMEYMECYDQRFWAQCKNIRRTNQLKSGLLVVGADDHHDAGAIAIVCRAAQPVQRGYVGSSGDSGGWGDSWGR